jgi:SulP family sulfate permease
MKKTCVADNRILPLKPTAVLINLLAGVLIGTITVTGSVSVAALIFAGTMSGYLAQGVHVALVSAFVIGIVVSLGGSCGIAIAMPQDRTAPILAIMSSGIVQAAPVTASGEEVFLAVFLAIAVTTLITGTFLLGLGISRAGGLIRYIPYSVLGGFFAGTGWLLVLGGLRVMTGLDLVSLVDMPQLAELDSLYRWLPGLAVALAVYGVSYFVNYAVSLPLVLFSSTGLFFAVSLAWGIGTEELTELGLLLGPLENGISNPLPEAIPGLFAQDNWTAFAGQWTSIGTILVISAVSILFAASALELLTGQDIDVNRELRVTGFANLAAGIGGGMVGFHSLSISSLVIRLGGTTRTVGFVAALICAAALVYGAGAISLLPRIVLGGLLLYLGLSFLAKWLINAWGRLPLNEYLVIPLILVVVATAGFIEGMLAGLLAALVLFVLNYSRTNVIRYELTGRQVHSRVERNPDDEHHLLESAESIHVLKIRGHLFFGTATQLSTRVRQRSEDLSKAPLEFVVIDFEQVTGIDSSASYAFYRMKKMATQTDFTVALTSLTPQMKAHLHVDELIQDDGNIRTFSDLDHGLEWCETILLERLQRSGTRTTSTMLEHLAEMFPDHRSRSDFAAYLTEQSFPAGHILIEQGNQASDVYFLEQGEVSVYLQSPDGSLKRIRRTGCGTILGEIGFYLGTPRSASVIANTSGKAYRLSTEALARMEAERPEFASALHRFIANLLAERLLHTTQTLETVIK